MMLMLALTKYSSKKKERIGQHCIDDHNTNQEVSYMNNKILSQITHFENFQSSFVPILSTLLVTHEDRSSYLMHYFVCSRTSYKYI